MTPESLASIMSEIADADPLDFADLSIREPDARALMANHFCEIDRQLAASGLDSENRLEIMAAIAAHAMVENLLLNFDRCRHASQVDAFRDWMHRYRLDGATDA